MTLVITSTMMAVNQELSNFGKKVWTGQEVIHLFFDERGIGGLPFRMRQAPLIQNGQAKMRPFSDDKKVPFRRERAPERLMSFE